MTAFEQMESVRLSEQKDSLLKRLADTEAENAVSSVTPTECTLFQPDKVFRILSLIQPADGYRDGNSTIEASLWSHLLIDSLIDTKVEGLY